MPDEAISPPTCSRSEEAEARFRDGAATLFLMRGGTIGTDQLLGETRDGEGMSLYYQKIIKALICSRVIVCMDRPRGSITICDESSVALRMGSIVTRRGNIGNQARMALRQT